MSITQNLPFAQDNASYQKFLKNIQDKVKAQFYMNKSIVYIKTQEKELEEAGISFSIKLIESLNKKPELLHKQYEDIKEEKEVKVNDDPFQPPFEEGLYIDELTETHRLLFNKFSIAPEHVLVVTKENESQREALSLEDIKACLITMKALKGFMYFNSGLNSGASVAHKHMQVIPYASVSDSALPIEKVAH